MARINFKDTAFSQYYYDSELDAVISCRTVNPKPLKWFDVPNSKTPRVVLVDNTGHTIHRSKPSIMKMLETPMMLADYVLFSDKHQVTEYFTKDVPLDKAIKDMKDFYFITDVAEIKVLDTSTNVVSLIDF